MAGSTGSFASNAFHSTPITEKCKGMIVDQLKTWLIEFCSCMGLSDCQADSVGETLAKRTSGDLDTGGILGLGMTRSDAVDSLQKGPLAATECIDMCVHETYSESLEVVQRYPIAEQM